MVQEEFTLGLNLKRISTISLAAKFWSSADIKNEIKSYFSEKKFQLYFHSFYISEKWYDISKKILGRINLLGLPFMLLKELQSAVVELGEKTHEWIYYINQILKLDYVFAEKIFWTSNGAVDEIKIFNLYWRHCPDLYKRESKYFHQITPIFALACIYGQVEFIQQHKKEMIKELRVENSGDEVYDIMSASTSFYLYNCLDGLQPIEKCVVNAHSYAFKFFWDRLDKIERFGIIENCAIISLCQNDNLFLKEKQCEIFLYLFNQMLEKQRQYIVKTRSWRIIQAFLPVWQYKEMILRFFDSVDFANIIVSLYLLSYVMDCKTKHNISGAPELSTVYLEVFRMIWIELPPKIKISYVIDNIQKIFLQNFDDSILSLILSDQDINEESKTQNRGSEKFKYLESFLRERNRSDIEKLIWIGKNKNLESITDVIAYYGCLKLAEEERFEDIDLLTKALKSDKVKKSIKESTYRSILDDYSRYCKCADKSECKQKLKLTKN